MSIITLTTDLGISDFYLPKIRLRLMFEAPNYQVIDLNNSVNKFDIKQSAFIVSSCLEFFPDGTIHILGVQTEITKDTEYFVAVYRNQYFIGAGNSAMGILFHEEPQYVYKIKKDVFPIDSFPTYSILTDVAIKIANKVPLNQWGEVYNGSLQVSMFSFYEDGPKITGIIIGIDSFGNGITNIPGELVLNKLKQYRSFELSVVSGFRTSRLSKFYSDVQEGEKIAIINSNGLIELAQNQGNAAQLLGLRINSSVNIYFE